MSEVKQYKKCPHCAEEILTEAKKCKHCGEFLGTPKSMPSPRAAVLEPAFAMSNLNTAVWAGPLGALMAGVGFFMPCVSRNGMNMSGADVAGQYFLSLWVAPAAAAGILVLFFIFLTKGQLKQAVGSTILLSVMAMGILYFKYYIAVTNGILSPDFRSQQSLDELGIKFGPGGYVILLGFAFAIIGAMFYGKTEKRPVSETRGES